jgi:AcrR family transcriptional regulator
MVNSRLTDHGFDGVSLADIARRARATRELILRHDAKA